MGYRLAMNAAIKMIFASRVVLFFSFTWTLIFPVNCETPPTSIVYPSATPTFDYHDTVVIVWITIWEETEVDIYCSQAAVYLPLYTASGGEDDVNSGTYTYPDIGSIFSERSYITSWPATCAITLVSSGIGASITGGEFVLTSDDSKPTVLWGPSVTSTLTNAQTSSASASSSSSSTGTGGTTTSSSFTSYPSTTRSTASTTFLTSTVLSTGTPSPTQSPSPSPSPLSTGAKAGIAVGCTIAGLIIIGLVGWYLYTRHRRPVGKPPVPVAGWTDKPELSAESTGSQIQTAKINELPTTADASHRQGLNELSSNSTLYRPSELPA